jgi:prevent-host-death family protein
MVFMEIANIHEAKTRLSRLIDQALAGEEVQIARSGQPLVRLVPIQLDSQPRQGGQLRGKMWIAEDFDAPDSEIEKLFCGEEM